MHSRAAATVTELTVNVNADGSLLQTFGPTILSGAAAADASGPSLTIDTPAVGQSDLGTLPVSWTATDLGSGVASAVAAIDLAGA